MDDVTTRLREILLPVFGLDSIAELPPGASLVEEIGADSLDFVEIVYLVEKEFGVALRMGEVLVADTSIDSDSLFAEGRLTQEGASLLQGQLKQGVERFKVGMTKMELFQSLSVEDIAMAIYQRLERVE
ncbi:MAG: phosphopantetheine-binding protein [Candidatus Thiodiazotropha endolucinida]